MTLLCVWAFTVIYTIHIFCMRRDQYDLPLADMHAVLSSFCSAHTGDVSGEVPHVPPAMYGVGVWVDRANLLPTVHDTLRRIDTKLLAHLPRPQPLEEEKGGNAAPEVDFKYIYEFAHWQTKQRDAFVAAHTAATFSNRDEAASAIGKLALQQQLGISSLRHSFIPDLDKEVHMVGISFFTLPTSLFSYDAVGEGMWCYTFNIRQAACVIFETPGEVVPHDSAAVHVSAGIASVMAEVLHVEDFSSNTVLQWNRRRQLDGCRYAVRSLQNLQASMEGHPEMVIPKTVRSIFETMACTVSRGAYVEAARVADDLQYHPLLTPQVHIPWDYSVMSQVSILLPALTMCCLGLKFVWEEWSIDKRRGKDAAGKEKAE